MSQILSKLERMMGNIRLENTAMREAGKNKFLDDVEESRKMHSSNVSHSRLQCNDITRLQKTRRRRLVEERCASAVTPHIIQSLCAFININLCLIYSLVMQKQYERTANALTISVYKSLAYLIDDCCFAKKQLIRNSPS